MCGAMKAGNAILDADMATLAGWLRGGFAWWTAELRGLLPARWRSGGKGFASTLLWHGPGDWEQSGAGAPVVLVDPDQCLMRTLTLPPLGESDMQRLVALDADRILPLPPERLVVGASADPADRTQVTVAGLPREAALQMAADLADAGIAPARVGVADPANPGHMAVDLTRAMRALVPVAGQGGARTAWWAIAGFLFALNLGLLIWRDVQSVSQLEALVEQQAPAVNTAQVIARRIAAADRSANDLLTRRARQDPLDALAAVTRAMPAQSWVQRYAWDGSAVRISGYKAPGADVTGALRKSGRFAEVRLAGADAMAEVPAGQPFDVTATVVGAAR